LKRATVEAGIYFYDLKTAAAIIFISNPNLRFRYGFGFALALGLPNETVEKPKFRKPPPVRRSDFHRRQGQNGVTGSK